METGAKRLPDQTQFPAGSGCLGLGRWPPREPTSDLRVILQVPEGGAGEPPGPKAVEAENWKKPRRSRATLIHFNVYSCLLEYLFCCF